jgi:phosphate-selective porin
MFCSDGRRLFLLGAYYNYTDSRHSKSLTISKPGGWDIYNSAITLASFNSDQYQKAGFEAVVQADRFCVQADMFLQNYNDVNNDGSQTNYGGFIMARWFLTRNDYRKYNLKSASWDVVDVSRPFKLVNECEVNWPSGYGAWELAAMYGVYDTFAFSTPANLLADDSRITNQQVGVALNWYWNQHVKWAVNYVHDMTKLRYADLGTSDNLSGDYLGMSCRVAW